MQQLPPQTEEAWVDYENNLLSYIRNGVLDGRIREIARACFDRRDVLQADESEEVIGKQKRDIVWPPGAYQPSQPDATDITQTVPASPPGSRTAKKVASKAPARRGMRRRGSDTFRFIDGRLYAKDDVRGLVVKHGALHHVIIRGAGDKSFKVEFCDKNGNLVTEPTKVPPKYRDPESKTGIQDPIFMSLKHFEATIRGLNPVNEVA